MMFHNPGCWKILLLLTGILVPTTFAFTLPSKLAPVIGIDLGTTYSCVGVYRNDHVEIIANDQGKRTTPSWVTFTDTGHLVGDSAKNQSALTSERTIFDVKRLIGRKFDDPEVQRDKKMLPYKIVNKDGKPYIQVQIKDGETKVFSPEEISAMILQKMKEMAESYLGMSIKDAVIAVPAYFDDAQRQATKDAGTISGLNVEMIIDEPIAAAIAYGLDKKGRDFRRPIKDAAIALPAHYDDAQWQATKDAGTISGLNVERIIDEPIAAAIAYGLDKKGGEMNILVFDLGGGTFDVTILRYSVYGVFAKNGDTHLGGEDFDHRVMEYLIKLIKKRHNKDISEDKNALGKLKKECERAKRVLSSQNQVLVAIESLFDGIDFSEPLTRARFEELNMDLFEKTMSPVKKALEDAKLKKNDIHEILLVGGSTRIPKVQQLLKDFFDGKELSQGVNPDEAVAFGAAIEGAILTGEYDRGPVFQELLGGPLRYAVLWSLGIETAGVMTKLIPRYTKMPTKKSHIITTSQDQQTKVEIKVCQGETKDCRELARLELSGISPAPRGVPQIEVTLEVDEHVLFVTAEDKASTNKISIRLLTGMNQVDGHVLFGTAEDKESTNKKSVWLMTGMNQDEFDQMLKEMKEEEEKKRKESYASRVKLETYIADMRIRDEHKLADKIDSDDKEKFESALKDALQWLSDNRHYADKDDFDEKRRELEDVCNPVINKAYEATTKSPTTHFKDEL